MLFLVDECVAKSVLQVLREAGESFETMIDRHGRGAADVRWLPDAGKHRLVVLSKDEAVRRKPGELQLLKEHRVLFFAFAPDPPMTREMQAAALRIALPHIRRMCSSRNAELGVIARIHANGAITRLAAP